MPTPPSASSKDLTEILVNFRQQLIAATVRQEELLKSVLDVQKDFRGEYAAVKKVLDSHASFLMKELPLPDKAFPNGTDQICQPGKMSGCMDQRLVEDTDFRNEMEQFRNLGKAVVQENADWHGAAETKSQSSSVPQSPREAVPFEERESARKNATGRLSKLHADDFRYSYITSLTSAQDFSKQAMGHNLGDKKMIIHHPCFKGTIHAVILINALGLGLQVDLQGGSWGTAWEVLDWISTGVFAMEAIIKIYCERFAYFLNGADLLDFLIVCSAIVDIFMSGANLVVFKVLRLIRLSKILKMKRDLIALIQGLFASLKAMFWVCVLMALVIYTSAILCVDVIRNEDGYQADGIDFDNDMYFGDLGSSMLTLFSIAINDTWSEIIWPVSRVQPLMLPFFAFFLVMTSFALMNALIGIVVERTTASANAVKEQDEQAKREEKLVIVTELVKLVDVLDQSHDGSITWEDLDKVKDTDTFKCLIDHFDFPPGFFITDLHTLLDDDGRGVLSRKEFIEGMFKLIFSCTDFHNQVLTKVSFAQIKQSIVQLRRDIFEEMKSIRINSTENISKLRRDILQDQHVSAAQRHLGGDEKYIPFK